MCIRDRQDTPKWLATFLCNLGGNKVCMKTYLIVFVSQVKDRKNFTKEHGDLCQCPQRPAWKASQPYPLPRTSR